MLAERVEASKTAGMVDGMKTYAAPWEGRVVLACKKCQKKIKKHGGPEALASLKKAVKRRNKERGDDLLHVIQIPCMDFCPKNAVAVCVPGQPADRVVILHCEGDIEGLY